MAKQMNYVQIPDGVTAEMAELMNLHNYPESYWKIINCAVDTRVPDDAMLFGKVMPRAGVVIFAGWENQAARQADPQAQNLIGMKTYRISKADYEQYFDPAAVLGPQDMNHIEAAYKYAEEKLEPNGLSFFDGATNV